jgi:2',3'-cyclic-nucleotide 2'-phosphodiesterase (5'-nucleotidase family)
MTIVEVSGQGLRKIVEKQAHNAGRRAGFSGMRVFIECQNDTMSIEMILNNGHVIDDEERVRIAASDFLATGGDGILTPAMPEGGFDYGDDPRLFREIVVDWLRAHGGTLNASEYQKEAHRRWNLPDSLPATCTL